MSVNPKLLLLWRREVYLAGEPLGKPSSRAMKLLRKAVVPAIVVEAAAYEGVVVTRVWKVEIGENSSRSGSADCSGFRGVGFRS